MDGIKQSSNVRKNKRRQDSTALDWRLKNDQQASFFQTTDNKGRFFLDTYKIFIDFTPMGNQIVMAQWFSIYSYYYYGQEAWLYCTIFLFFCTSSTRTGVPAKRRPVWNPSIVSSTLFHRNNETTMSHTKFPSLFLHGGKLQWECGMLSWWKCCCSGPFVLFSKVGGCLVLRVTTLSQRSSQIDRFLGVCLLTANMFNKCCLPPQLTKMHSDRPTL